jgi:Flp pilus assembly protein TadG
MFSLYKNRDGATAIEFALLAIPYVFLTVGIIELAIMYAAASLLEGATTSAARLIRTGQIQQSGADPETMFRDALCDYATALISCEDVSIQVTQVPSFSDVDGMPVEFDEEGNMEEGTFNTGGSNDKVLIRTSYQYELMTPFIGPLLGGPESKMTFLSTIVIQTEPYDFEN